MIRFWILEQTSFLPPATDHQGPSEFDLSDHPSNSPTPNHATSRNVPNIYKKIAIVYVQEKTRVRLK